MATPDYFDPFTGAALTGASAPRNQPADIRDPRYGDRPTQPMEVHVREDGMRVEVFHGQRPSWDSQWRREQPRRRTDRFPERRPTERDALRHLDGIPTGAHPLDVEAHRGLVRTLKPTVGRALERGDIEALARVRESLPAW